MDNIIKKKGVGMEEIVEEEDIEMGGIRSELLRWYNEGKRESLEVGREEGRQLGLRDGRISGIEEGRQLGLRDGIEEGRQSGIRYCKRQMLLSILPKKLGVELPEDIIEKIENATDEVLNELEENIFNFVTVSDVEKVLEFSA